ncbi:unnamed protein product [Parnassius apollo]|uniref:(apollo) hypothetical protein n=1 Tax=Parnassius apollo TaxID=110799 RepID=A0A8S3Y3I4_PARAO|nr:unnamed protein product [Parnassius apollo]
MYLKELPPFKTLEVTFPAAYNVLLVDAELNKMIVETKYHLMRNNSKVVFSGTNHDPFKTSPFAFQEVQRKGYLTIIAEDCHLSGFAIATMADNSYVINLGHDTFRVSNCKFGLEHNEKEYEKFIQLKDVMVDGLDSAYSPKLGGPYKIQTIGIAEALRYNTLRVRGKIILHLDNVTTRHEFSAELIDVSVNMELDLEDKSNSSFKTDTNVSWRNMVFSITNDKSIGKKITINERILTESLISGYLINEIPKCLPRRLNKLNENIDSRTQDMYLGNNVNPSSMVEDEPNSTVEEESDRKIEEVSNDEKKVITELIIREALPDTKKLSYTSLSFSGDDSNDDSDKD